MASPKTNADVVLQVGAMFRGQASSSIGVIRTRSLPRASVDSSLAVMETIRAPIFRIKGSKATSSSLSPDFPTAITTSSLATIPISPCIPSEPWRNTAGVPVETIVAAILFAMRPDFPTPMRMTFPWQACNILTASSKRELKLSSKWVRALASNRMTRRSSSRISMWLLFHVPSEK